MSKILFSQFFAISEISNTAECEGCCEITLSCYAKELDKKKIKIEQEPAIHFQVYDDEAANMKINQFVKLCLFAAEKEDADKLPDEEVVA